MEKIDEIKKRLVFKVKDASNTNTIFDTRKYLLYDDVIEILNEVLNIPIVVSSKFYCSNDRVKKQRCKEQCAWCEGNE